MTDIVLPGIQENTNEAIEEEVRKNVLLTSVDNIVKWARSSSLWPVTLVLHFAPIKCMPLHHHR